MYRYFTLLLVLLLNELNIILINSWKYFPSELIEKSSFNKLSISGMTTSEITSRPTVRIVIFDKVIGYLNWYHDDFKQDAEEQCATKCIISNRRDEVSLADVVIFHAPTHGRMHPVFPHVFIIIYIIFI